MKPELLALIFGSFVGCIALIASAFKHLTMRNHNRISVRPNLKIEREEITDCPLKIILKNIGLGLAHIDRFEIQVDNILISGEYKKAVERVISLLGLNGTDTIINLLSKGDEIDIDETYLLFEANPINSNDYEKISSALHRLNYKIKYCSIFNESFIL